MCRNVNVRVKVEQTWAELLNRISLLNRPSGHVGHHLQAQQSYQESLKADALTTWWSGRQSAASRLLTLLVALDFYSKS